MLKTFTSFDVAAIVLELRAKVKGARVRNVYQAQGTLLLKLHQPNLPVLGLLIEPGKRLHLTSYTMEKPRRPPAFCMALRKYLKNGVINEIHQHEFDRIVNIEMAARDGVYTLVLEFFGEGNAILVNPQGDVQQALTFKRMRDREILRGKPFQHAPSSGKNPLKLHLSDLLELTSFGELEVVRALTKLLSISGGYAEEVLLGAQLDKLKKCDTLERTDIARIFRSLNEAFSPLKTGKLAPCMVVDSGNRRVDVTPVQLKKYENLGCEKFETFSDALDEYYATASADQETSILTEHVESEIAKQQRILAKQKASLEETAKEASLMRRTGEAIYVHFHQLQTLLHQIADDRQKEVSWKEISSRIEEGHLRCQTSSVCLASLDTQKLILKASIDGLSVSLGLRHSVQENAASYYSRAKKAERKVRGGEAAIEATLAKLEELRRKKQTAAKHVSKPRPMKKKKHWYEKFRWFYTSENLLAVGGRDAVTNEILIKKHMMPHDLVFHADIAGAPFVLLKTEGKAPSQESVFEAAQLAGAHSRAWKAKFGAIDVYWVHPQQVTKTPPSGEYLPRGAFMIRGKKTYVRRIPVRVAIGVDVLKEPPTVIGGPKQAVADKTALYVELIPGDLSRSRLAGEIRRKLAGKAPRELHSEVAKIPLDEIQTHIPYGQGRIDNPNDAS